MSTYADRHASPPPATRRRAPARPRKVWSPESSTDRRRRRLRGRHLHGFSHWPRSCIGAVPPACADLPQAFRSPSTSVACSIRYIRGGLHDPGGLDGPVVISQPPSAASGPVMVYFPTNPEAYPDLTRRSAGFQSKTPVSWGRQATRQTSRGTKESLYGPLVLHPSPNLEAAGFFFSRGNRSRRHTPGGGCRELRCAKEDASRQGGQ